MEEYIWYWPESLGAQCLLDVGNNFVRLGGWRVAIDGMPILIHEKFGKVPLDSIKAQSPVLLLLEKSVERVGVFPVYLIRSITNDTPILQTKRTVYFCVQIRLELVLILDKFLNVDFTRRLLNRYTHLFCSHCIFARLTCPLNWLHGKAATSSPFSLYLSRISFS